MKRLIVMRHTKSDWSGGAANDHDRPLNARGRAAAVNLGKWLGRNDLTPDQLLCSSAERTQETFQRLNLPPETQTVFARALYLSSPDTILSVLRGARAQTVLIIGHNPGIGAFAEEIVSAPPKHPDFVRYPTGATLVAEFDIKTWDEVHWANGNAIHFVVPRELDQND